MNFKKMKNGFISMHGTTYSNESIVFIFHRSNIILKIKNKAYMLIIEDENIEISKEQYEELYELIQID